MSILGRSTEARPIKAQEKASIHDLCREASVVLNGKYGQLSMSRTVIWHIFTADAQSKTGES